MSARKASGHGSSRRRRSVVALAGLVVALSGVLGLASAGATSSPPFAITHLVIPLFVKENGPRGTRAVYWQGNPTFPVTVHETGICPESVNCGPRDARGFGTPPSTSVFPAKHNPLVNTNFYFCSGNVTSDYVIGVEVWLTDSAGHKTAPVRNFWVCKTH